MSQLIPKFLTAGLAALALACSSSGSKPSSQTSTPGVAVKLAGMVSGTSGALAFNQQPLQTSGATVTTNGAPTTVARIQPGVVIQATATRTTQGLQLVTADLDQALEGAIVSIDLAGSRFVVLGKTVLVDALTQIVQEGTGAAPLSLTLADLKVGDYVEVYGSQSADGSVQATRVELGAAGPDNLDEFHGMVSALDTSAMTFQAGGFLVSYGSATVQGTLANGLKVEIRGTASGTAFAAAWVKVETEVNDEGSELELSGPISGLDTTARTFLLMSYTVDYSTAKVEGTLAEGAQVEVEGLAGPSGTMTLAAREVTVRFTSAGEGASYSEVEGTVTALDPSAGTITVGSTTYWVDSATLFVKAGAPASLSDVTVGANVVLHVLSTKTNAAGQSYASLVVVMGS
ncbi:MAG TPA: DUF5666 domain-containing protein [Geothrix sp.]|nr:DUF5666 domain-containing protein [Geothrix sp.]